MLVLTIQKNDAIRSFIIVIYDAKKHELARYQVPISVAAPFANRIIRDVLNIPDWSAKLQEPWYTLAPRADGELQRSPEPPGPTSLYGEQYDPASETGTAISMHPEASTRFFEMRLLDLQKELFKGIYTVDDIFLQGAHYLLHNGIQKGASPGDKGPYFYEVIPSSRVVQSVGSDLLPEDAFRNDGIFRLPPRTQDIPRIQFRPVQQSPLPEFDPAAFGLVESRGQGKEQAGRVFIPEKLYEDLSTRLKLSSKKEEGGYILGNVYRSAGSPENEDSPDFRWLVEVTDLVMAEDTIGSSALLLFTGDSWSKISRKRDRDFPMRRLVGWFHTHIFPATDSFGLSGLDQDMHSWYLPRPWQVAILLNLEDGSERTVRCYQRGPEGDLVETPFEVVKPAVKAE